MFAAIEHEKQTTVAQEVDDPVGWGGVMNDETQCRRDRAGNKQHNLQRTMIEEMNVALERLPHLMRDRDGDGGLANATRAPERHKAFVQQTGRQFPQDVLSPDHQADAVWERGHRRRRCLGCLRHRWWSQAARAAMNGRYEAIAPAWDVCDIARSVLSVAESLPELGNVNAQAALFHREPGPRVREHVTLRHDIAGAPDKQAQ